MFKSKKDLLDENAELKKELSDVKNENLSRIEDRNELSSLRELYKLCLLYTSRQP